MGNSWIVSKFGGSSVRDAQAIRRCIKIILKNPKRRLVVVSATYNTTNQLELMAKLAVDDRWQEALEELNKYYQRHLGIAEGLNILKETQGEIEKLFREGENLLMGMHALRECPKKAMDILYALGERASSILFSEALKLEAGPSLTVTLLDARRIIKTNGHFGSAAPLLDETENQAKSFVLPLLENDPTKIIVTQGFIGSTMLGDTTILGREGSDYSAAIFARVTSSESMEIWTDVPGFFTSDPKLVPEAKTIPEMTYLEATSMAMLGAKILYAKTLDPVESVGIPCFVGSSLRPDDGGTWIRNQKTTQKNSPKVLGPTAMFSNTSYSLVSHTGQLERYFLKNVLDLCDQFGLAYQFLQFAGNTVSFILHGKVPPSPEALEALRNLGILTIKPKVALVSFIAPFSEVPRLAGKILKRIPEVLEDAFPLAQCDQSMTFKSSEESLERGLPELHRLLQSF